MLHFDAVSGTASADIITCFDTAKVLAHCLKEIHCAVNWLGSAAQCPLCLNVHNLLQF